MKHEEAELQIKIVNQLRKNFPDLVIYAIENERATSPAAGARRKAMGVLAGVADLEIMGIHKPTGHGVTLRVELKTATGKQSDNQKKFAADCKRLNQAYAVCRSYEECVDFMAKCMII